MKTFTNLCITLAASVTLFAPSAEKAQADDLLQFMPGMSRHIFEEGTYLEFGAKHQDWDQSTDLAKFFGPPAGELSNDFWAYSGALRGDINKRLSYALIVDQPILSHATIEDYSTPGLASIIPDSYVDLETQQVSAILSYDVTPNIALFGGLRAQHLSVIATYDGSITLHPDATTFALDPFTDWEYGYLLGAAYERPENNLRLALTYHSEISYSFETDERDGALSPFDGNLDYTTPQFLQFDYQFGIAPETALFGFARWTDGSEGSLATDSYLTGPAAELGPMAGYADDFWVYNIGVAQQFTDQLAGAFSLTYEPSSDAHIVAMLPYDGAITGTASLSYDINNFNITGAISYTALGDAEFGSRFEFGPGGFAEVPNSFTDGSIWGAELRVSYRF